MTESHSTSPTTGVRQSGQPEPSRPHLRWMIRKDIPELHRIEAASFDCPWTVREFLSCLAGPKTIGIIAEDGRGRILGYAIYKLVQCRIVLVNFAVSPESRRHGVGSLILQKLISKLSPGRRYIIDAKVRESNLRAQLFFRSLGFNATSIHRRYYEARDTEEDAYNMRYRVWPVANESSLPARVISSNPHRFKYLLP